MFNRRKKLLYLGMALIGFAGCKKEYTCGYSYYYNPAYIAFKGFSPIELEQVIVYRYTGDGNFTTLLSTDSLDGSAGITEGDTVTMPITMVFSP